MNVLLLGGRAPACLEWARIFSAAGWHVTVADSLRMPLTRTSRAVQRFIHLPQPGIHPAQWLKTLASAIDTYQIDLLIPTCEEVFYLAYGLDQISSHCKILTSPFTLLHQLHHKGDFASLTKQWPVSAPETHLLTSKDAVANFFPDTRNWVFKPAYSRFAVHTLICPSETALNRLSPTPEKPWVAQRLVSGRELCSFSILINGQLRAHNSYLSRYRAGQGASICFEPVTAPLAQTFVEHFGQQTGYTGQVGFDFIEQTDGKLHVLECNPRATSGIHLFNDQSDQLVETMLADTTDTVLTPSGHSRMIGLAMLLYQLQPSNRVSSFWQDFRAAQDVIFRPHDPLPLLGQAAAIAELGIRSLRHRCSLLAATSRDIEWNGQKMETLFHQKNL